MKYDIAALKRKMLVKYPFFGSVVASVGYKEDKDISTAGTDGEIIYYNPEYLEGLSVEEQIFIFAHEVCHVAFNHILRSKGKDAELWNIATDGVVNQFLKRDGLKMVPGCVDMKEAINYDAEQVYEKLLQEKQKRQHMQQNEQDNEQNKQSSRQQSGSFQNQDQQKSHGENKQEQEKKLQEQSNGIDEDSQKKEKEDVGHDTHSMWKQAVKKHKEQREKSDKKENLFDRLLGTNKKEKKELEKKQEELESMGEKDAFKKNLEDKKKQLEELKEAISKQVLQAGIGTNSIVRTVSDIGKSKPIVDWRHVLREAIKYDVDWSYKNATLEDGVVTANLEEQLVPETEIVLDTSGSINEVLLKNFLRECKNILQHTKLKVGCFDTKFYGFNEVRTEEDIENIRFEGGGGTNFDVAVGAFSRRVENKIIFTDGESSMPNMPVDAIWIVFGERRINPKGGKVIYITQEQLNRLYSYEIESKKKVKTR